MTECKHIYGLYEGYHLDEYPKLITDKDWPFPLDVKFGYCPLCGIELKAHAEADEPPTLIGGFNPLREIIIDEE